MTRRQPPHAQFAEKRDALNSIVEYLEKAGVVGYAIEIPQSLVENETCRPSPWRFRDLGRFAVVLPYHADLNEDPGERDDIGGPDLPPTPHPLRAIDAAVSYEAALRQWTRCYAVVMPVMVLDTEPGHAFRRTCISLDVPDCEGGTGPLYRAATANEPSGRVHLAHCQAGGGGRVLPSRGPGKHVPNRPIR